MEGYKQTVIGLIPEDWEAKDISAFCLLQRGYDITESTKSVGDVPVYSSSGLAYFHNEAKVHPPGVVTGRKGILGKVFYIEEPFWPHDTTLWVKDFKSNDAKYVSFFLTYFNLKRFDAATSVPTLNRNNLIGISIPVPPLPEQKAIAQSLSDVDALITECDRIITKKRNTKQGTMQQLLTGKKRLPGFSGKWEMKKLGDYVDITSGESPSKFHFAEGGTPYFKVEQLNNCNKYQQETPYYIKYDKPIPYGSIIFPKRGASILLNKIRILACDSFMDTNLMALTVKNKLDNEFLFYILSYQELWKIADTTSIPQINNKHINPFLIPFTLPSEQKAIAQILSDMDTEIAGLEQKRDKYKTIKQGMMQELLTGKTRLKSDLDN